MVDGRRQPSRCHDEGVGLGASFRSRTCPRFFSYNGSPFDVIHYPVARPDVAAVFPFLPFAGDSGFACWARVGDMSGKSIVVRCIDRATGRPFFGDDQDFLYVFPTPGEAIPDAPRRVRVHGNPLEEHFRVVGATTFMRLQSALRQFVGREFSDFRHTLDWGCGCGRVARYFEKASPESFLGVDVDADNVGWCRQNLQTGRFECIPLHPPTTLAPASVDLVIGVSVFTHLKEREQVEWLDELHRVCRSGAVLLLTFHGDGAAVMKGLSVDQFAERKLRGVITLPNGGYDADLPEKDYYHDVYHTAPYIRRSWGRRFQILKILPAYVGQQDLAVLRKR